MSGSDTTHGGELIPRVQVSSPSFRRANIEKAHNRRATADRSTTVICRVGQKHGVELFINMKLPPAFIRNHCQSSRPLGLLCCIEHMGLREWVCGAMEMERPWGFRGPTALSLGKGSQAGLQLWSNPRPGLISDLAVDPGGNCLPHLWVSVACSVRYRVLCGLIFKARGCRSHVR